MQIETFKLEKWINENSEVARYDLSTTCVKALSINDLAEICDENFDKMFKLKLNYGQLYGTDALRNAICKLYGNQKSENITVTLGGIGANSLVIQTLVEKGDKVVCICPCYQQAYSLPKIYGANVHLVFLNSKDWSLDIENFKQIVGNDTKLICLTNPNNPSGRILNELDEVINIAKTCGAYVWADEVYRGLSHNNNPYSKSVADVYDKGISTGSMSKAYSLAGVRLGWVCANPELIEKINSNREYNTISISAIDDFVATVALENHEKIVQRNLEIIEKNKQILADFVRSSKNLSWVEPNAGSIACINYDFDTNSIDFCKKIQMETGILLIPAQCFDMNEKFFRIGYGMEEKILQEVLGKFYDAL